MTLEKISFVARLGMAIQIIVGIGLPIGLMYWGHKKLKAKFSSFYIGCAVFFVSVFILESLANNMVFADAGNDFSGHVLLFALYAGAAAAIFEEVARFIAFKFFLKDRMNAGDALMYGFGQGGLEAILIIGINGINTFITSIMVNTGSMEAALEPMDEAMRNESIAAISALWTTKAWVYYAEAVQQFFALVLSVALTVIVYKAVKSNHLEMVATAMLIHFFVDFASVVFSKTLPALVTEILLAVFSIATAAYAYKIAKDELSVLFGHKNPEAEPIKEQAE